MKNKVFSVIIFVLAASTYFTDSASAQAMKPTTTAAQAPPPVSAVAPAGRRKRVAVFDFDYATVRTNSAALFGSDVDIGKGISDCW